MSIRSVVRTLLIPLLTLFLHVSTQAEVQMIRIDGVINGVSQKFITDVVSRAEKAKANALVIQLDTPGGMLESTRMIVQCFLAADVPIVVYVSPDGARAGSAGVFITLAAHIAAMAPSSNIGAAHPVTIGGGALPGSGAPDTSQSRVMTEKITNDAAAMVRSIAETRGRNVEWAEKAVRQSESITAREAQEAGVIDLIAPSVDSLLVLIDGKLVKLKSSEQTLHTAGASIVVTEMTWREKLFDKLSDPNLAYIFMMVGIYGILFEFYNPGAVLPGVLGGLGLLLSFFAFQSLPVSAVGIMLILFGVALLLLEIKVTSYGALTVGGAVSLFLGSVMLFDTDITAFRVSLGVIIPAVLTTVLFILVAVGMGIKAQGRKVETGKEALIGSTGEVVEAFTADGSRYKGKVLVKGEYWLARAETAISAGGRIEVKSIDGLMLDVKPY